MFLTSQVQARLDLVRWGLGSTWHLLELYRIPRLALQRQSGQSEIITLCHSYFRTVSNCNSDHNDCISLQDVVVTNDRWGNGCYCKHGGYFNCADKFTPGHLPNHKWEKCQSVDTISWGYRRNMKLTELMDLPSIIKVWCVAIEQKCFTQMILLDSCIVNNVYEWNMDTKLYESSCGV